MLNIGFELRFISENEKEELVKDAKDISISLSKMITFLVEHEKNKAEQQNKLE